MNRFSCEGAVKIYKLIKMQNGDEALRKPLVLNRNGNHICLLSYYMPFLYNSENGFSQNYILYIKKDVSWGISLHL